MHKLMYCVTYVKVSWSYWNECIKSQSPLTKPLLNKNSHINTNSHMHKKRHMNQVASYAYVTHMNQNLTFEHDITNINESCHMYESFGTHETARFGEGSLS